MVSTSRLGPNRSDDERRGKRGWLARGDGKEVRLRKVMEQQWYSQSFVSKPSICLAFVHSLATSSLDFHLLLPLPSSRC